MSPLSIVNLLKAEQTILCSVESCTGGLLGHLVTNEPGASKVYWGGFVTYDNSAKYALGVSKELVQTFGAVSKEVAEAMAKSGLARLSDNIERLNSYALIKNPQHLACIALTGMAGPTDGAHDKLGCCFIALALSEKTVIVEGFTAPQDLDREGVKLAFVYEAFKLLQQHLLISSPNHSRKIPVY